MKKQLGLIITPGPAGLAIPLIIGGFVAVALVATVITYAVLRKLKKQKA